MITVLRKTDFQKIKVDNATLCFRPMTYFDEVSIRSIAQKDGAEQLENIIEVVRYILTSMLKKIEGVNYSDGKPFALEFDENEKLTDECLLDLTTMARFKDFQIALVALIKNESGKIKDYEGKLVEGIEIVRTENQLIAKKKK